MATAQPTLYVMGDTPMMRTLDPMDRANFLRGVQRANRAAAAGDHDAPLRFVRYIETLEAFTDDYADGAPELRLFAWQSRAVETINDAAARLTGNVRPANLRELAQVVADRNAMRLADVLRLDVEDVATLTV